MAVTVGIRELGWSNLEHISVHSSSRSSISNATIHAGVKPSAFGTCNSAYQRCMVMNGPKHFGNKAWIPVRVEPPNFW